MLAPYLVTVETGVWKRVAESPGRGSLTVSRDGLLAVHSRQAYRGDNNLYLIDRAGKVAYKSGRGPFGFKPGEMEQALAMLLLDQPGRGKPAGGGDGR